MGADLGSDTGNAVVNTGTQATAALLRLFALAAEAAVRRPERVRVRTEAKIAAEKLDRMKASEKISRRTGLADHRLLARSGEPLTVTGVYLDKKEVRDFSACCRREGVLFSVLTNAQRKRDGEKAFLLVECRTKDLERILAAAERYNEEKRLQARGRDGDAAYGAGREKAAAEAGAKRPEAQKDARKEDPRRHGRMAMEEVRSVIKVKKEAAREAAGAAAEPAGKMQKVKVPVKPGRGG